MNQTIKKHSTLWLFNLLFLLLCTGRLNGALYTTQSFEAFFEITKGFTEKSLVVFDVDRVLIEPRDAIMRYPNQRLLWELRYQYGNHLSPDELANLTSIVSLSESREVIDPLTVSFINFLKSKNIPVIALTATSVQGYGKIPSIPDWRIKDLSRFGICFESFASHPFIELSQLYGRGPAPIFKSGILFSAGYPKGDVLEAFLDSVSFLPDKVLFVDDLLHNLVSVHQSLTNMGVSDIFAFQFTGADALPNTIDVPVATHQIKTLLQEGIWQTDEEARAFLMDAK